MAYTYEFNKETCPWKKVCGSYNKEDCNGSCIRYMKMHYLTENSLLTKRQQLPVCLIPEPIDVKAFENLNKIRENILDFVKNGSGLIICSETNGNGKTQWAIKLLMRYFSQIWSTDSFNTRGLFISVAKLFSEKKEAISLGTNEYLQHIKETVLDADLVVWDDIGLKTLSAHEYEYLFGIINDRIDSGKANIYTANFTKEGLREVLGDRLYSRIVVGSKMIILNGSDHRGNKKW